MGNTKSASGCQFPEERAARPTVRQAAKRVLDALDRLTTGTEVAGFHGWENGAGEPVGDELEEARRELEILLAETPRSMYVVAGADFDIPAFEEVWRTAAVQDAGRKYGFRGVAEAVWAQAFPCYLAAPSENDADPHGSVSGSHEPAGAVSAS